MRPSFSCRARGAGWGLKCRLVCTEGYGGLHRRSWDGRLICLVARKVMAGRTGGYGTEGYGGVARKTIAGCTAACRGLGGMGIARVDPQFLRFGPVFNRWSDTEGWFMNKLSRSNSTKNALSKVGLSQVGKPWARADLFFLEYSLRRGMSLVEIAGFLGRTVDEVREKAKSLNG